MRAKHRLLHQYVRETFPDFPVGKVPSRWTLARVWGEWFGPDGGRQRYLRTAEAAAEAGVGHRFVVHRPVPVLALDSTPLPVHRPRNGQLCVQLGDVGRLGGGTARSSSHNGREPDAHAASV
jgi:hypothetical protein